ncbi:MAG: cytochrome c [Rhodospirillales bacterium]|nr:MAG: cytochrome c [Rhodospirillales bacterium]
MVTGALVLIAGVWLWTDIPRTPRQLYESRCSACHALADLSRRPSDELVNIIETMRHRNGAASVISETEAEEIVAYLKSLKRN